MVELIKFGVLLNLAVVSSFKLLMINNINEDEIVPKLAKMLNEQDESSEIENHISVRNGRKDLRDDRNKFKRRRLIKTILPHDHDVHFQTHGKAIYTPLVRIHHKKPIFVKDNDEYQTKFDDRSENVSENKSEERFWENLKSVILKNKDKNLKRVDNISKYKKVLEDYYKFEDGEESKFDSKVNSREFVGNRKRKHYVKYNKYLERNKSSIFKHTKVRIGPEMDNCKKNLRSFSDYFNKTKISEKICAFLKKIKRPVSAKEHLRQRSGEENDPLAPGKIPFNIDMQEASTKKPNQWLPTYSFWNYWTYDKTLHRDGCKEGLVRYGDKCIGSLPH